MAKSKTRLKTEIENLNFVIQQKDSTIKALKNTCWDLMDLRDKDLKQANSYFQVGLLLGIILGLILTLAMYSIKGGI